MTTATLRLPVRSALVQHNPYPTHGVEVLASIRLDILADALRSMEHDDTDPGERPMSADQCRDALLREMLGGWSPSELVEAKIPGVLQMWDEIQEIRALVGDDGTHGGPAQVLARKLEAQADEIAALRREMDEARAIITDCHSVSGNHTGSPDNMADALENIKGITTPTPGAQA